MQMAHSYWSKGHTWENTRTNGKLWHNNGNERTQNTMGKSTATETQWRKTNGSAATSFGSAKQRDTGTVLGTEISTTGNLRKSAGARIAKSHHTWKSVSREICRIKVIKPRVKLTMRNSLIWSTILYGLHAKELPRNLVRRLETYMYKHIRKWWTQDGKKMPGTRKTDLQEDQTIHDGILVGQYANNDNAQADARHQNNTSQKAQGNADT